MRKKQFHTRKTEHNQPILKHLLKSGSLLLVLLVLSDSFVFMNGQTREEADIKLGYNVYIGSNFRIVGKNTVKPMPTSIIDPMINNIDSIVYKSTMGPFIGNELSYELLKNLELNVGIEFNQQTYNYEFIGDSAVQSGNIQHYVIAQKRIFYCSQVPFGVNYSLGRFSFNLGARLHFFEVESSTWISSDDNKSTYYNFQFFPNTSFEKVLFPFIGISYQLSRDTQIPISLSSMYELKSGYGSVFIFRITFNLI